MFLFGIKVIHEQSCVLFCFIHRVLAYSNVNEGIKVLVCIYFIELKVRVLDEIH